jgi:hypothetical protein
MARTGKVIDRDFGWKAFLETVNRIEREKPDVVVGLTGPDAEMMHGAKIVAVKVGKKSQGVIQRGTRNVATLAASHEFGLGVPERSFLRSTFDLNIQAYVRYLNRGLGKEINDAARNKQSFGAKDSQTLKRLALKMESDIKLRIGRRQIPPPNAPSTIAKKKSSTPLVDTGQLRRAITSDVRIGKRGARSLAGAGDR